MCVVILLFSVSLSLADVEKATFPSWQYLECEVGPISQWQECSLNKDDLVFRKATSIFSLKSTDPGRMRRLSVSCTGAGWWTSGAKRKQTAL